MLWGVIAVSLGLVVGGCVGHLAGLVRVRGVWQSATAGLLSTWLTTLAMAGVVILRERAAGYGIFDAGAFRWGSPSDVAWFVLGLVLWLALFAGLHLLLARFGPPRMAPRLPVVVGCIGSVVVSVPFAWVMSHVRF